MLKTKSILYALCIWFCSLSVYAAEPVIHLDASAPNSFRLGHEGQVMEWYSLTDNIIFRAPDSSSAPIYLTDHHSGLPAVQFRGNSERLGIVPENLPELSSGSVHIFVIARSGERLPDEQTIIGMGKDYPAFNLTDDGQLYRLFTGMAGHQQPEGIQADTSLHIFEFDHVIDRNLASKSSRTHWPGEFFIDGALCGKLFLPAAGLPLDKLTLGNAPDGKSPFFGMISEVLIYNEPLDRTEKENVRHSLAGKWGIILNETDILDPSIPRLEEHRVGPKNKCSAFAYFDQTPESPDGSRIAYIVYEGNPSSAKRLPVSLWICDRDMTRHRLVTKNVIVTNYHNGSMGHWASNDLFVIGCDGYQEVRVIDVNTGYTVFGPYTKCWPGGISHNGLVLLHTVAGSNIGGPGLFSLDTGTGFLTKIADTYDFEKFYDEYQWTGDADPRTWRFVHGKYSPDGKKIACCISPHGGPQYFFIADADGSDIRIFGNRMPQKGQDIPLHYQWYDNEHIFGADQETLDGSPNNLQVKIWDLDGNYIRTAAGQSNHPAMSPDRRYFTGDSFYYDDPSWLVIYRNGETKPAAVVFEEEGIYPMWMLSAHANPAFSRDGKRLYYKRPVDDRMFQAYYVNLDTLE